MSIDVDRLRAEIEADPSRAEAGLARFDASMSRAARDRHADIEVDTLGAMSDLARMEPLIDYATRDREINVSVNRSMIDRATNAVGAFGSAVTRAGAAAAGSAAEGFGFLSRRIMDTGDAASKTTTQMGSTGMSKAMFASTMAASVLAGGIQGLVLAMASLAASLPLILGLLSALPGLFGAIGAGALVLVGALQPLVGLLGAVMPLLAGAGVVLGTLAAAIIPVVQGVTAYKDAQEDAGKQTEALAGKQDVLRGKQDALVNSNRAVADSHRAVAAATRQVAQAERALADARKALREGPRDAREALEDQHLRTRQAILSERRAVLALEDAQKNLAKAQSKTADVGYELRQQVDEFTGKTYDVAFASSEAVDATESERDARLALKQAELDLLRARDDSQDQQRLLNEMERKGIQQSDIMVERRRAVADAEYALADARRAVADAQRGVADANKRVADAQKDVTDAQKDLAKQIEQGTPAMEAWAKAQERLTPAGREFVQFISDEFLPAFGDISKAAQDSMLPGVQKGLRLWLTTFDEIEGEVRIVGKMIGDTFEEFSKFWTGPEGQQRLTRMFRNLNKVIDAGLGIITPFSKAMVAITDAASPMVTRWFDAIADSLERWSEAQNNDELEGLTDFFDRAGRFASKWWKVMKGMGSVIGEISEAVEPYAIEWLDSMAESLEKTADALGTKKGQKGLSDWIEKQLPTLDQLWETVKGIGDLLFNTSKGGKDSAFYKALDEINTNMLPELKELFEDIDQSDLLPTLTKAVTKFIDLMNNVDWDDVAKVMEITGKILMATSPVLKLLDSMDELSKANKNMVSDLETSFTVLTDGLPVAANAMIDRIQRNWGQFSGWFQRKFVDPVEDAVNWLFGFIPGASADSKGRVQSHWDGLGGWFKRKVIDPVVDWFEKLPDRIEALGRAFLMAGKVLGEKIAQGIKDRVFDIPGVDLTPEQSDKSGGTPGGGVVSGFGGGRWTGGPVEKDKAYIVGEKRPEVFVPSTSGRIMPRATPEMLSGSKDGMSAADIQRLVDAVIEKAKPDVQMTNNFEEKVDPHHVARELAWSLR